MRHFVLDHPVDAIIQGLAAGGANHLTSHDGFDANAAQHALLDNLRHAGRYAVNFADSWRKTSET